MGGSSSGIQNRSPTKEEFETMETILMIPLFEELLGEATEVEKGMKKWLDERESVLLI